MKDETLKELRTIADKSTKVVGWYAHRSETNAHGEHVAQVRGPFGRWFEVSGGDNGMNDPVKYPVPVASLGDDAEFCAAAMMSLVPLLDEVERLRAIVAHPCQAPSDEDAEKAANEWFSRTYGELRADGITMSRRAFLAGFRFAKGEKP